jgi:hypothetical protein
MQRSLVPSAVAAAMSTASAVGLSVEDAVIVHESNRIAVRLRPCNVLARVAVATPRTQRNAALEVDVGRRLAETDSPAAGPEPRVEPRAYVRDGFVVTLWTYYELAASSGVGPREYSRALERLHAGMRGMDLPAPHFTQRVAEAQRLLADRGQTPGLADADRGLLSDALRQLVSAIAERSVVEQLLHGEPHPGNLLRTRHGLRFIDFETCCRGPVEFDVAHAPETVGKQYPGVDPGLLRECRIVTLALVATWRWDRDDRLPDGHRMGIELLGEVRAGLDRLGRTNTPRS